MKTVKVGEKEDGDKTHNIKTDSKWGQKQKN